MQKSWSNNPNAPQIQRSWYIQEKEYFAGGPIGAIFYGIVIVLFFRCMRSSLVSTNRNGEGIKWGLVAYILAMFSFATINTAMNLNIQSISYVNGRGTDVTPSGPLKSEELIYSKATNILPDFVYILNTWLADGILLHRCFVIYAMNYWIIIFPCLVYLASVATGILFIYQISRGEYGKSWTFGSNFGYPYFSISFSLNVLLTLMILARLIFRGWNLPNSTGVLVRAIGFFKAAVTLLLESYAIYAVNSLLFIGAWTAGSPIEYIFFSVLVEVQVIAPFLIIHRITKRRALTSDIILNSSSAYFGSNTESIDDSWTRTNGSSMSSTGIHEENPRDLGVEVARIVNARRDEV